MAAIAPAALVVAAIAVLPGPAGAATVAADAGSLRALVGETPFTFELRGGGRSVLRQLGGGGSGPSGSLGFRRAGRWFHATTLSGAHRIRGAYEATLATEDPTTTIAIRIARGREGVIRLQASLQGPALGVDAIGIGFGARDGERYLGFGERSNAVDQRGGVVENYVAEGAYQAEERPFVPNAFVPPWGFRGRDDATYFPMPWLLSSAGYGVLVDNTQSSYFRLGSDRSDAWSLEVAAGPEGAPETATAPPPTELSMRFFAGPRPAAVLRRLTRAIGRQPPPEPWYLGAWFQRTGDDEAADAAALRRLDTPVSVYQTYLHYLPCGDQQGIEAEQPRRTAILHALGYAVTTYFNPMICVDYSPAYERAQAAGALTETQAGAPYVYRYLEFNVSQFDFSAASGDSQFAGLLGEAAADGYDGWMEDFGEYTPLDSRSADGSTGYAMHNLYPRLYHCAAWDWAARQRKPLLRYIRSGWTGSARCSPVVWNGDPTTDWGFDGLRSAVQNALSIGLSGVGIWGSDIGGYFALGTRRLTPELLTRWVQFGALSPVMRTQANGFSLPPRERPQVTDPDQIGNWRRYTKLHTQLYPYLRAAAATYRRSGMPVMRHLALRYPGLARATAVEDEFLFGPDLLAAPVLEPGQRRRALYLPPGTWVDLWRSLRYRKGDGSLQLRRAKLLRGGRRGRDATLPAPLDELPLLARAGSLLALLPADVDTLAPYGKAQRGLVHLGDRRGRMQLLAFPRGRSSGRFLTAGRLRSREGRGSWTLQITDTRPRRWSLQAGLGALQRPFRPCEVTVDGKALKSSMWEYDPKGRVLRATFRADRNARLVVSGC